MKYRCRRRVGIKLAALLTAGMVFQTTQCAINPQELLLQWVQSTASVLISSWVNDQFNVQQSPF